jgi:flagellar motor switch protein FliM
MANTYALPQLAAEPSTQTVVPAIDVPLSDEELFPDPQIAGTERLSLDPSVARLPVELDVAIPVREFRVRNLVSLQPGQVIETQWEDKGDLPLFAGNVQLAWSEFEVVGTRMAVRITRLA